MGWLGLKKRPEHEDLEVEAPQPLEPLPPALCLLVPDVAGVTSFRMRRFFDVAEAAEFIHSLPSAHGLHAFWGLHQPPTPEGNGEAMVLIRAAEDSETVYVVSFVDLDSALSFARFEVKRGMNLGLLLIYWAEIVDVEADEAGVRFTPDLPPTPAYQTSVFAANAYTEPAPPIIAPPEPEGGAEAEPQLLEGDEPGPAAYTLPQEDELPAPELSHAPESEEEFEQYAADGQAEATAEPEAVAAEDPKSLVVEEPETVADAEPASPALGEPGPTPEAMSSTATEEEIDIEHEARAFLKATSNGRTPPAELESTDFDESAEPEPEPVATAEIADDPPAPVEPEPVVAVEPEPAQVPELPAEPGPVEEPEPLPVAEPAAAITASEIIAAPNHPSLNGDVPGDEPDESRVEEVEKILRVKRWDKRNSPFRGFDSPPGRF